MSKKSIIGEDGKKYQVKGKKPFYKKWWFIALAIVFIFSLASGLGSDEPGDEASLPEDKKAEEVINKTVEKDEGKQEIVQEKEEPVEVVEKDPPLPDVSSEYKSALKKANAYATTMHMSKRGVYDQLTSEYGEKFPADAAQYAIDNLDVDWNNEALLKGESYAKTMHMSKAGVYDQLISDAGEKFTPKEAQYAIDNINADWKENALKKAKSYQETMAMSKEGIRDQLTSDYGEKFTTEEANYAVENLD